MPRRKLGYLFLECIPKRDKHNETQILVNFLRMFLDHDIDRVKRVRINSKNHFLKILNNRKYNNYSIIHISAHGAEEGFETPQGIVSFDDLVSKIGLRKRILFFSSCGLGKESNVASIAVLSAISKPNNYPWYYIAPRRDVLFHDSALFSIIFYYYLQIKDYSVERAFWRAKEMGIPGDFRLIKIKKIKRTKEGGIVYVGRNPKRSV